MPKDDADKSHSTFTSKTTPTEGRPGYEDTVVTTTTTTTDPIAAATELTESFRDVTEELRDLKMVAGRVRTLRILMLLVFVLFAITGWLMWRIDESQEAGCRAGNNVRRGLLNVADTLEASQQAPRPDGRERTPAEVEAGRQFVADLRDDFALRRC